ncbi:hypothetical protein U3A55_11985 [Salarchaeum sp. III]|uniref:hypothetical protein n=1 Tax=Salarchaeum sp. III TaxID=3107927 RepID=UPI002ED7CCE2
MLSETEDAIQRLAIEGAAEDGRFRSRFIWVQLIETDASTPEKPRVEQIGKYLNDHRSFRGYVLEKEHDDFQNFNWWWLTERRDSDTDDLDEWYRVECTDCKWAFESPYLDNVTERADGHDGIADGHSVDDIDTTTV